ncbi:MAG: FeoB small GTPase domain-containing protein [Bacillota bacterium]
MASDGLFRTGPRAASGSHPVVALAGNPNTGKSTVFNALTGLAQHTGNWPGKTVRTAWGTARHRGRLYTLVDLPGTYSLLAGSAEEEVASDFLCHGRPDATVVVADATALERNLNLVLQVLEVTGKVVVLLNLIDEARRKGYDIDVGVLAEGLGVPVVPAVARDGQGLPELMDTVAALCDGSLVTHPRPVVYPPDVEESLRRLEARLAGRLPRGAPLRWLAVRALCGDARVLRLLAGPAPPPGSPAPAGPAPPPGSPLPSPGFSPVVRPRPAVSRTSPETKRSAGP